MNKLRKTLGSLFVTQEAAERKAVKSVEATTEETTEEATTTETADDDEEESVSETSTDRTTTTSATDVVTLKLGAYNKLKADANSVVGLQKQVADLSAKAKKWDAHLASVQSVKAAGDLNSATETSETEADAETKRLKARYGKLID